MLCNAKRAPAGAPLIFVSATAVTALPSHLCNFHYPCLLPPSLRGLCPFIIYYSFRTALLCLIEMGTPFLIHLPSLQADTVLFVNLLIFLFLVLSVALEAGSYRPLR